VVFWLRIVELIALASQARVRYIQSLAANGRYLIQRMVSLRIDFHAWGGGGEDGDMVRIQQITVHPRFVVNGPFVSQARYLLSPLYYKTERGLK
jgi:hypothetical protein